MSNPPHPRSGADPTPSCSDGSWPRRCGPLLVFLETPRSWSELETWASERGMSGCRLRNMLAWLEGRKIAGSYTERRGFDAGAPGPTTWRRCASPAMIA